MYAGTEGVRTQFFSANGCLGCHSGNVQADGSGGRVFSSHTLATATVTGTATGISAANYTAAYNAANWAVGWPAMPSGVDTSNPSDKVSLTLLNNWITQGRANFEAATISLGAATSLGRYSATLNATVNDNGSDTTYTLSWKKNTDVSYTNSVTFYTVGGATASTDNSDTEGWTGGDGSTVSFAHAITGLSCFTDYDVRLSATNNGAGTPTAVTTTFKTTTCPSVNSVSNANITEDASYTSAALSSSNASSLSVSYSLDATSVSRGLTINGSNQITWAAGSTSDVPTTNTDYSVTVTGSYSGAGGSSTASTSFTITVTPVNDAPTLVSPIPDTGAIKNSPFSYNVASYFKDDDDPNDGTARTWSIVSGPSWLTTISSLGVISGLPGDTALASESVTVRMADGGENGVSPAEDTFLIAVSGTNAAPSLSAIANQTVNEDASVNVATTASPDADDANNCSGALTWTLNNEPAFVTVSCSGTLTIAPTQADLDAGSPQANKTYSNIELQVADGGENGSTPASRTFSVTVVAQNGSPVIGSSDPATAQNTSTSSRNWQPTVTDEDHASGFVWSFDAGSNHPSGTTINSSTGQVAWSAPVGDVAPGTYDVVVKVADPLGASGTRTFNFTINDGDSDTVADYTDNCVSDSNTTQLDTDSDNAGNACDIDDDNDGVSDLVEVENSYDPLVVQDHSALDKDGDGIVNYDEYLACADTTTCSAISNDSVPPVVTPEAIADLIATGLLTPVDLNATATDMPDGAVTVSIYSVDGVPVYGAPDPYQFRPGAHTVEWEAYDSAGNRGTATQTVNVKPLVSMGGSQVVGVGQTAYVPVRLLGEAPSYPVVVTVDASGATAGVDYTLASGTVQFDSAETVKYLQVNVIDNGVMADKRLVLTVSGITGAAAPAGDAQLSHTLRLTALPAPPDATLQVSQSDELRQVIYQDDGSFVAEALVSDPNDVGLVTCEGWQAAPFVTSAGGTACQLIVDPSGVAPGLYTLTVTFGDEDFIVTRHIDISLVGGSAPALGGDDSDGDGVTNDVELAVDANGNGLLDYLDINGGSAPESIQLSLAASELPLMAVTDSGLRLVAGSFAIAAQSTTQAGIQVYETQVARGASPILDRNFAAIGAIYDFGVEELGDTTVVHVVLPLPVVLAPGAQWRELSAGNQWQAFVTTAADKLMSAPRGADGQCPLPQDDAYVNGLVAGNACVQVVITDGGPNDADGQVNGSVRVTGAPTVRREEVAATIPTESQSGGSADFWTLMVLVLALMGFRRKEQLQ